MLAKVLGRIINKPFLLGMTFILVIFALAAGLPYFYLSEVRAFEEVSIPAEGYLLQGYLSPGKAPGGLWVVFVHGNRQDGQAGELYRKLRNNLPGEVGVLAIDMRGFGKSSNEGMYQAARILDRSEDLDAAVNYLKANLGVHETRIVLMGHSLGAYQVMKAAHRSEYRLVVSIGLGNWDAVLSSAEQVQQYIQKFNNNTSVSLTPERLYQEAASFTPGQLFSGCPQTQVIVIYGSMEDTIAQISPFYQEAQARCGRLLRWATIPLADHMFSTENASLPVPVRTFFTNFSLGLLKLRLNHFLLSP